MASAGPSIPARDSLHSLDDYRDALERIDAALRVGGHPEWLRDFLVQQRSFLSAHVASKEALLRAAATAVKEAPAGE